MFDFYRNNLPAEFLGSKVYGKVRAILQAGKVDPLLAAAAITETAEMYCDRHLTVLCHASKNRFLELPINGLFIWNTAIINKHVWSCLSWLPNNCDSQFYTELMGKPFSFDDKHDLRIDKPKHLDWLKEQTSFWFPANAIKRRI